MPPPLSYLIGTAATIAGILLLARLFPAEAYSNRRFASSTRNYPVGIKPPSRRCRSIPPPTMAAETNTSAAAVLGGFLKFLEDEVFRKLGYLYSLRDGNLLGAVRHGGLIPGDRDLDAVLLLPLDEGLDEVRASIQTRLDALGKPFELQVNDDGRSRWLVFLQPNTDGGPGAEPHHADIIVYPSRLFSEPIAGFDGRRVFSTRVQRAFHGLCYCRHWPLARASCFEAAPRYLKRIYGDYSKPSSRHALGADLLEEVYV